MGCGVYLRAATITLSSGIVRAYSRAATKRGAASI